MRTGGCCVMILALLGPAAAGGAQFGPDLPPQRGEVAADDKAFALARQAYQQNLSRYANDSEILVLPGLLANRKDKWVRIWGKATNLQPNDPVEFLVIPPESGKDYEAMAVAFVRPYDVHRALEFIGMKPGQPIDPGINRFWPKGERVLMTFEWAGQRVRAEELILDVRTGKPLPATGLVFTGSRWIEPEEGGKPLYAADVADPRSIVSIYNDYGTVLDVPRQAFKSEVYGLQKPNPAHRFGAGEPVQIVLEPEYRDGRTRIVELDLRLLPQGRFSLEEKTGKSMVEGASLVHVLAAFSKLAESGKDPYVTVHPDEQMTLAAMREFYALLLSVDREEGIRIEPPPEGHLYYRAMFPREQWRDRKNRLGRPWELHLAEKEGKIAGTLVLPADEINDNKGMGDLQFPVASGEQVATVLVEKSDRWSQVVYVFASPSMTYGQLMSFVRPGMKTHPTVYAFLPTR